MYTKADFINAAANTIDNYPSLAPLYRANDPRIIQNIEAMATMLAMMSAQIETAMAEPFDKARDATVLADAAMRGIIRKARSGRVRVLLDNQSDTAISIQAGRNVTDSVGNLYRIETPVNVNPNQTGTFEATQVAVTTITHTVSGSVPFYAIEIVDPNDGSYLSGIEVYDKDGEFIYRERYVNILAGERVFHVESDDRQRVYVRFGQADVVGYQPNDGEIITLKISRSVGGISPDYGSPFAFEYLLDSFEADIDLSLDALLDKGQDPIDISTLRDLAKYPSVYDHNAVFLGEFDFLVRRTYSDTQFLSVWNENIEEKVRGANVDNINCLFVACLSATGDEAILTETNPLSPVSPTLITSLTSSQTGIKQTILNSDNSYKVKFYTPIKSEIFINITGTVSTSYTAGDVESQIRKLVLDEYGIDSYTAKRGSAKPIYQKIYKLIRENITAFSDGNADIQVAITPYSGVMRPELWRYVSETSLTVSITTANITVSGWS